MTVIHIAFLLLMMSDQRLPKSDKSRNVGELAHIEINTSHEVLISMTYLLPIFATSNTKRLATKIASFLGARHYDFCILSIVGNRNSLYAKVTVFIRTLQLTTFNNSRSHSLVNFVTNLLYPFGVGRHTASNFLSVTRAG